MALAVLARSKQRTGSERARALARRFEQANQALISAVQKVSDARWATPAPGGRWSVAATAYHLASTHQALADFIVAVAQGRPLPSLGDECIDPPGGADPPLGARVSKRLAGALLRRHGQAAAQRLAALDDAQLGRATSYFGTSLTAAQLVDELLIGHIEEHSGSLGQPIR